MSILLEETPTRQAPQRQHVPLASSRSWRYAGLAALLAAVVLILALASGHGAARSVAGSGTASTSPAAGLPEAVGKGLPIGAPVVGSARVPDAPAAAADSGAPPVAEARVVKTGTIALIARHGEVPGLVTAVTRAAQAAGGYVADSTTSEDGARPSGHITVRVPVARFDDLVSSVRRMHATVRTASISGRDVTAQYADVEAQLRTLRAARERFLVILGRTRTIPEILTVQQRVDDVSGQIDRLEGSRRLLASQSDLSLLAVDVSEAGDPILEPVGNGGLGQAWRDARAGFVDGVEAIVRHSGRVLLLLLCVGIVGLLAGGVLKVARRRAG